MRAKPVTSIFTALLFALAMSACGDRAGEPAAAKSEAANAEIEAPEISVYQAALTSAERPEADRGSDAGRKPAQVLAFMGIEPGMVVLDMFAGGGWYSEILARVVGSDGRVISHSNQAYVSFVGDALAERVADGRLPNVEISMVENNEWNFEEDSLDAVLLAQSFHDLYLQDTDGWPAIDIDALLAELKKGLKPGGIVAIIDHRATAGAATEVAETIHRIDPDVVVQRMEAAGFICEAISDMLSNPEDDLGLSVFDEGVRGRTDRFVMRFRNPK